MESRLLNLLLTSMLLAAWLACTATAALAQEPGGDGDIVGDGDPVFTPEPERRDIREAKIDASDIEFGLHAGLISIEDFGTSNLAGATFGYHVSEDIFVEAMLGMAEAGRTSFELLAGNVVLLNGDERDFNYYNISIGYELLPGETFIGRRHAFNSGMYLSGGAGATEFAGDRLLTWNVGIGYRLLLRDWLALRVDIRDHIFNIDVIGEDKTTHNFALAGGLTVFF